jgi:hypothetical protein
MNTRFLIAIGRRFSSLSAAGARLGRAAFKRILDWVLLPWLPVSRTEEQEAPCSSSRRRYRRKRFEYGE